MSLLVLIACSKSKLDRAAPARELYTGALFRHSVEYAEKVLAARWAVLSAKHGVVLPAAVLEPYELALRDLSRAERAEWARETGAEIGAVLGPFGPHDQIVFLAGAPYLACSGFVPGLRVSSAPLRGLGIGERLRWLKRQLSCVRS